MDHTPTPEIAPRADTVELVAAPDGTWVPAPAPQHRPASRRARLRKLVTPRDARAYITPGERLTICTRRHWLVPLRAAFRATAMTGAIAGFVIAAPALPLAIQLLLALAGIGHTAWVGWCVLNWRVEQIAVTDTRLIRVFGILTTTVDTVPLSKITDMSFRQSIPGRIFDYGQLRVETAGQKQALSRLDFLPSPSTIYRALL